MTKNIAKIYLLLLLMLLSTPLFADNLVQSSQEGLSVLNEIKKDDDFGQQILDWITHGTTNPEHGSRSLMSTMGSVLNVIALSVMAFLAALGGLTFIIQTANKGTPGGQVISSFWMPIRVSTATILLIPLSSGFSTLQYGVMSIAETGNAHANYAMEKGLDYVYDYGVYKTPGLEDSSSALIGWIGSEVCYQYINSYTNQETVKRNVKQTVDGSTVTTKISYDYNELNDTFQSNDPRTGYCGSISMQVTADSTGEDSWFFSTANDAANRNSFTILKNAQYKLLTENQAAISQIASAVLTDQEALKALQEYGASEQSTYESAVAEVRGNINSAATDLSKVVNSFNNGIRASLASAINALTAVESADNENVSENWKDQTVKAGWPALGTIFWQVNANQSKINKLGSTMGIIYNPPSLDDQWKTDDRLTLISTRVHSVSSNYKMTPAAMSADTFELSAIAEAGGDGDIGSSIKSGVYKAVSAPVKWMLQDNGTTDLIINLQYYGSSAGALAESIWWAKTLAISMTQATADTIKNTANNIGNAALKIPVLGWFAAGGSKIFAGGGDFTIRFAERVSGLLDTLILGFIIVGFTLGVMLPTIPLISWFMGVISWMLFYIECLIVSSFWLAAHGTFEKEGWGSEHTRQGYMLMIGLYLNPILRVAGFMAVFLCLGPIGMMTAWLISYINGVIISGATLLFFYFASMAVVAIFAYNVLVRVFSLPSEVFERGLRWINGGNEVTGDSQSENTTRQNIGMMISKGEHAAQHASRTPAGLSPAGFAADAAGKGAKG